MLSRRAIIGGITSLLATKPVIARRKHPQIGGGDGGGGGGGYVAKAVHFGIDVNIMPSINGQNVGVDTSKALSSLWFRVPTGSISSFPTLWSLRWTDVQHIFGQEIGGVNDTDISTFVVNQALGQTVRIDSPDGAIVENQWYNLLSYGNYNFPPGAKTLVQYLNDVAIGAITDTLDATTILFSDIIQQVTLPASNVPLEFADVQIYTNLDIDLSITANRRLFISAAGKPVDPAIAVAALGNPIILFSGNNTGFPINQGTGGVFTLTGALTNATTSPSD